MSTANAHPHLRLVGANDRWTDAASTARRAVVEENRAAASNSGLEPADPRWVLAMKAYSQLQGSALTLERRQGVMRTARQLGVRPFEATLIIAIVQDQARRGGEPGDAAPTLAMLDKPKPPSSAQTAWTRWIAAVITALAANAFLIWWLTG